MKTLLLILTLAVTTTGRAADIDHYKVVWNSPSADARGFMPIGNGDIGLNFWVEQSGDMSFYIGKTDSWDESIQLLKLGLVKVKLTPALSMDGFSQTLDLKKGLITIRNKQCQINVWVDANNPVIQLDVNSLDGQPLTAATTFSTWRTEKKAIDPKGGTGWIAAKAFAYPDEILAAKTGQIGWFHRNLTSPRHEHFALQKLEEVETLYQDPILNRTSGVIIRGDEMVTTSNQTIKNKDPKEAFSIRLYPLVKITDTKEQWLQDVEKLATTIETLDANQRWQQHVEYWQNFWNRSWIFATGSQSKSIKQAPFRVGVDSKIGSLIGQAKAGSTMAAAEIVSRGYTYQRWVQACSGRGAYPIKFNGSIFNLQGKTPDDRLWGGGTYWFQNTRLIYWTMLRMGDFEMMHPWFEFFKRNLEARKYATQKYYNHEGAFFPETSTLWGNCEHYSYGRNRRGRADGAIVNDYVRYYWQGGIELVTIMLDYYEFTQDAEFRDATLLPIAKEILTFYDQHWKRDDKGRIRFDPSQSLETWHRAVNPLPIIAGLRHIIPRMKAVTKDQKLNMAWDKTLRDLPAIPMGSKGGKPALIPAESFSVRRNMENPELYAVFPYRQYTVASGADLAPAINAFHHRLFKRVDWWQQSGIQAAMLGLTATAQSLVTNRANNYKRDYRFPVAWGTAPYSPDHDHGSAMVNTLQRMILQYEGDKIVILPAWPKVWDVAFKLHAPQNTTVEGVYRDGKMEEFIVTPESRRKDVILQP